MRVQWVPQSPENRQENFRHVDISGVYCPKSQTEGIFGVSELQTIFCTGDFVLGTLYLVWIPESSKKITTFCSPECQGEIKLLWNAPPSINAVNRVDGLSAWYDTSSKLLLLENGLAFFVSKKPLTMHWKSPTVIHSFRRLELYSGNTVMFTHGK